VDAAFRGLGAMAVAFFGAGATSVLRKQSSLRTTALRLVGSAISGAATLTASAANLDGHLPEGAQVAVAGASGTYTLTSKAVADGGEIEIAFSPALSSGAAEGSIVTITREYGETLFKGMNGKQSQTDDGQIPAGQLVRVLVWREGPAPEMGDLLDGLPILSVEPIGAASVSRWRVTVGANS
jgi:hypothetical protein